VAYSSLHVPFITWNLVIMLPRTAEQQSPSATAPRSRRCSPQLHCCGNLKNSQYSLSLFRMIHEDVERLDLRVFFLRVGNHLRDPWYHNSGNNNIGLTLYSSDNRRSVVKFFCSTALELADCRHYTFVSQVATRARRSDGSYTIILPWSPDYVWKRMFDDIFWIITS
jgi:hypothetical protein